MSTVYVDGKLELFFIEFIVIVIAAAFIVALQLESRMKKEGKKKL